MDWHHWDRVEMLARPQQQNSQSQRLRLVRLPRTTVVHLQRRYW
jgi:hypothetical protein